MRTFIVAAKRTAFGDFGGKLKGKTATELGGLASIAALSQLPKNTPIDQVIFGNVLQSSKCAPYLARHIGLRAGLDISVPALTINRLCGSGFESLALAVKEINAGDAQIVLAGGTESMSQAPHVVRDIRFGVKYGVEPKMEDSLATTLVDQFPKPMGMGITAENLAKKYNITRRECDEFAALSHQRWAEAHKADIFKDEIAPVSLKDRKGNVIPFEVDEHPRAETTADSIAKLRPAFLENGVTTAGNASGICDGAAAVIVASEEAVSKYGLKPLALIRSTHAVGVAPEIMGIGPCPAIVGALKKAQLSLKDMNVVEVNEAFAAQFLAVARELKLDMAKTNIHGGAISIGHPLAASGARILAHLTYELLRNQNNKYAAGSACIGGGQGIAVILERV